MEAVRIAAAAQVQGIENPRVNTSASCTVAGYGGTPASCMDCSTFAGPRKFSSPAGLCGDGLSGGALRRNARLSLSSSSKTLWRVSGLAFSPPSAAAAAAAVRSFHEESLLTDVDSQDLEKETPSLLEQCSDLDWKRLVHDLRSEALHGLQYSGMRALSLKALEKIMMSWIHDQLVDGIESPIAGKIPAEEPRWSYESAAKDLSMQAKLQAAQVLAKGVDSSFDWETDVAELHQRILLQGGAESSLLIPEQNLVQGLAHDEDDGSSIHLARETLPSTVVVNGQAEPAVLEPQVDIVRSSSESNSNGSAKGQSLFSLGAAVATGLALEGTWMLDAVAAEQSLEAIEAAARAPSWLVPAVLVFPPLSYLLFNLYRDQVNPYAKLTDWMFGVVFITIVSNIFMMAVWGVRLY